MLEARWHRGLLRPLLGGMALALLGLALWMIPWLPAPGGGRQALHAPPAMAAPLVHGRVLWKNSEDTVTDVGINVADQASGQVVMSTRTDATGWYTLTVGVGFWLLDIPSTDHYWGYSQAVTVLPHDEYVLDFAITPRTPDPTVPPATPLPAGAGPTPITATTVPLSPPAGPVTLPVNGRPSDPLGIMLLLLIAFGTLGVGLALRSSHKKLKNHL